MKIYSVVKKVYGVQVHEASCHKELHCKCGLKNDSLIVLFPGEIIIVFDECEYTQFTTSVNRELYEDTWSFIVLMRGKFCSICLSKSNFEIKEIGCSLPTTQSSSGPSL